MPPLRPGLSLLPTPAPNYQYMFKGHPLTFDSHRPLCDLLLSAKGFEEHSNWGVSKGGSKRKERQKEAKESERKWKRRNGNDTRCALLTDTRNKSIRQEKQSWGLYAIGRRLDRKWAQAMGRGVRM